MSISINGLVLLLGGLLFGVPARSEITLPPSPERRPTPGPALLNPSEVVPNNPAPLSPAKTNQPLRLRLDLRDGSRIIGVPASITLPLASSLGTVEVDLKRVESIQFQDDLESAIIVFRNGDRVTGLIKLNAFALKTVFGDVKIPLATIKQLGVMPAGQTAGALLNLNFGSTNKTGVAAVGLGPEDYWNSYVSPWQQSGTLDKLRFSNGQLTEARLEVSNGGGHWGNQTGDPMYDSYVYPNSHSGNVLVTVSHLPAGEYDFYLYGHADPGGQGESDSLFTVKAGARLYGPAGTKKSAGWKALAPWVEGFQYVVLRGAQVNDADSLLITVAPGFDGQPSQGTAVINGLQIAPAGAFAK